MILRTHIQRQIRLFSIGCLLILLHGFGLPDLHADQVVPVRFEMGESGDYRKTGTGFFLSINSDVYLLTSFKTRSEFEQETTCLWNGTNSRIEEKPVRDIVATDWKDHEDIGLSVAAVSSEIREVLRENRSPIRFDPNKKQEANLIGSGLIAVSFAIPRGETLVECRVPMTVVSKPAFLRFDSKDYSGTLIYPAFEVCEGAALLQKVDSGFDLVGIVTSCVPNKRKEFSGFAIGIFFKDFLERL